MGDLRGAFLSLCRESAVDPPEAVLSQLQRGPRLDLSGHTLSADICSILSRTLHRSHSVTELLLSDCILSEEGAIALLSGLIGNTSLKVLDLKGNNLRAAGAEVLGRMLAQNNSLHRLVLEWNALGLWDEAFSLFCEGLASNSSLKQLDLRNNQINPQGASELSQALRRNNTLEMLDLRWNNIGLLGGRSLLEALQKNKCLVQLEMAGNNIPSDMMRGLEQITAHNSEQHNAMRENRSRTQVLSKEIQTLKEEKGRQFLSLMETIDRQRDEMCRSNRCSSVQIGHLQEALSEKTSAVSSLTAKLQMAEAALALSEQKNTNIAALLTQIKTEKEKLLEQHNREKRELEDSLLREIQSLTNNNIELRNKVEEMERKCKSQKQHIFDLKQQLINSTAELKIRLAQAEDRLEKEKLYSKQALESQSSLHHKEVENVNRHLDESERALQERIFKLESQRIQLEEDVSQAKAMCASERAQAQEELSRVRAQLRLEEREQVSSLKEKLSSLRCSLQEAQLHTSQQKDLISELQARSGQHSLEVDTLRRRIDELQQELLGKEQEKVGEVNKVRVELQEQIGRLETERAAQTGLKERIGALEREMKVQSSNHREALRDKDSEITSLLEKVRLRDVQIQRITEAEAQRTSYLQSAILTYVQSSPLGHFSSPNKPL